MVVMVTPDVPTEVNKTVVYHPKVSTLTNSQYQLPNRVNERKWIKEETTYHYLHQVILVEIPTQMMMIMMRMIKMEVMAGAEEVDVRNGTREDHCFQGMLLPVFGGC